MPTNEQSTFIAPNYIVDQFDELTDLKYSDLENLEEYRTLKMQKNDGIAVDEVRLAELELIFQNKIVTSSRWNKFQNALLGMQGFIKNEVQDYVILKQGEMDDYVDGAESDLTDYIDTKTALFDAKLNRFTFLDEYNSITQYRVWNTLSYQGESYLCILDSLGNLPTNTTYFKKIAQKGAQGEDGQQGLPGLGLVFRNSYSATETYNTDECIEYNGSLYACKQDGVSGFLPTNTTYWSLAIAKGASILVTTLRNTVTVSTNVSNVQFLSGGITAFNKNTDSLFVYVNSTYLELTQDYTINANGISIDKVSGSWDGTENSIIFNFVVIKNIIESITFNDGALIDEGSILKSALVQSVQDSIDSIGDVADLETTAKDTLVNAVNETSNKINVLSEDVGSVSGLNTTFKDNVVGAINEVNTKLNNINLSNNVSNFICSSINEGTQIKIDWTNNSDATFIKNELFVSTNDIRNTNIEYCIVNATKIYDGINNTYTYDTIKNTLYYFKIFTTYSIGGIEYISSGVSAQILAEDKTPPDPITNFIAKAGNTEVDLSWTNPINVDFSKVKILRKTGSYPTSNIDGDVAYEGSGTSFKDVELTNNVTYYYRAFTIDDSNNINSDISQQITCTPIPYYIYGVRIDKTNSNPDTRVTYISDAVGFTPMRGNNGNFLDGSWGFFCDEFEIKPCVLKNKIVQYYLNPNDFTKKANGGDAVLTGTDGDVMIEWGVPVWYKWTDEGDTYTIEISNKEFDGSVKYGVEIEEGYNLVPYYPLLTSQILFPILFKATDSQTALGRGYVDGNTGYITTGNTNTKGFMFGETTGKQQMKFLGIEDYWGNKRWWIDGLVTDSSYNILIGKTGFNDSGAGYTSFSSGLSANTAGYIDTVQGGNDKGFIINAGSGSESTYYADYGDLSSGRVAYFGGSLSIWSYAGFTYLRLNYDSSSSSAYIGARLFCASNGKFYIGAYLGTEQSGKLRSISGTTPSDTKTIGAFRTLARANN